MRSVLQWLLILVIGGSGAQSLANSLETTSGFWRYWGDGQAEIAIYELTTERYGERRNGYAVSIIVTEPWNVLKNVKSDRPKGPDVIQALKLNLIRHYQTGVYDYHTMTSAFMALQPHQKIAKHGALKLTFSAQEWCGQAFQVLEFGPDETRSQYHSYFESSPGGSQTTPALMGEDFLWLIARKFNRSAPPPLMIRSLYDTRIHHKALEPIGTKQRVDGQTLVIETPRGNYTFTRGPSLNAPLESWSTPWNERAVLLTSQRLPYWRLNSARGVSELLELGLNSASSRLKRSR